MTRFKLILTTDESTLLDQYSIDVFKNLDEVSESDLNDSDFAYTLNEVIRKAELLTGIESDIFRELAKALGVK